MEARRKELWSQLESIGVIRHGSFRFKSGSNNESVYVDLRRVPSYPRLFAELCVHLARLITERDVVIAGVPLGALPYATMVAQILGLPSVMIRERTKTDHGLVGTEIEGETHGRDIVLIEDVITTGGSVDAAARILKRNGLILRRVVAVFDRSPISCPIHDTLTKPFASSDWRHTFVSVFDRTFLHLQTPPTSSVSSRKRAVWWGGRWVETGTNQVTERLFAAMRTKRSNLIVAVDNSDPAEVLRLVRTIAPYVCAIKLHLDLVCFPDRTQRDAFFDKLTGLAREHGFLIIEDRKFSDIGAVMRMQLAQLPNCIDMVTAHAITGLASLMQLTRSTAPNDVKEGQDMKEVGVLLVTELSSAGSLIDHVYTARAVEMLDALPNAVGAVSQTRLGRFLTAMPGINIDVSSDGQGQQYRRPAPHMADLFIVGRAITHAASPAAAAERHRLACWPTETETEMVPAKL